MNTLSRWNQTSKDFSQQTGQTYGWALAATSNVGPFSAIGVLARWHAYIIRPRAPEPTQQCRLCYTDGRRNDRHSNFCPVCRSGYKQPGASACSECAELSSLSAPAFNLCYSLPLAVARQVAAAAAAAIYPKHRLAAATLVVSLQQLYSAESSSIYETRDGDQAASVERLVSLGVSCNSLTLHAGLL